MGRGRTREGNGKRKEGRERGAGRDDKGSSVG